MVRLWQQWKQSSHSVVQLAVPVIVVEEVASIVFPWTFSRHKDVEFFVWLLLAIYFDARFTPFRQREERAYDKVSRHRWDVCRCLLLWLLFLLSAPARSRLVSAYSNGDIAVRRNKALLLVGPVAFFCGTVYWWRRLKTMETAKKSFAVSVHPASRRRTTRSRANTSASSGCSRNSGHWSNESLFSWASFTRLTASESNEDGFADDTGASTRDSSHREDWTISSDEEGAPGSSTSTVNPVKQFPLPRTPPEPVPAVVLRSRTRINSSDI